MSEDQKNDLVYLTMKMAVVQMWMKDRHRFLLSSQQRDELADWLDELVEEIAGRIHRHVKIDRALTKQLEMSMKTNSRISAELSDCKVALAKAST